MGAEGGCPLRQHRHTGRDGRGADRLHREQPGQLRVRGRPSPRSQPRTRRERRPQAGAVAGAGRLEHPTRARGAGDPVLLFLRELHRLFDNPLSRPRGFPGRRRVLPQDGQGHSQLLRDRHRARSRVAAGRGRSQRSRLAAGKEAGERARVPSTGESGRERKSQPERRHGPERRGPQHEAGQPHDHGLARRHSSPQSLRGARLRQAAQRNGGDGRSDQAER